MSSKTTKRKIEKFNGTDYPLWSLLMKNVLRELELAKYIGIATTDANYKKNEDEQALAEIQFALEKPQLRAVMTCKTTKEAWDKLKAKYLHSSESNLVFLKNQFLSLKMKSDETIQEFIGRIDEMAERLSALGDEVKEVDKALILTRGVPDSYKMTVVALQESNNFKDYEHVTNSLLNEESRCNEKEDTNDDKAFYTDPRGCSSRGRFRGRFPHNTRGRGTRGGFRQNPSPRFDGKCHFCGIYGHKISECRKRENS